MNRRTLENAITTHITEVTSSLEMAEYAEVMRWLSEWAQEKAELAEHLPDFEEENE
ncbi:hypothetical protein [Sangeribacter muris]|uniref:hypothetical protein n=1 Tax=Sangeribacter muris TaxID=2880703 RepID=UPI00244E57B8|nr:hypothetical protein [Sangeribacter muris]